MLMLASLGRPEASAIVYGRLLDANLFWAAAAGATLAREAASGSVVLQRALPVAGLDITRFEAALQSFVDAAERLRDRLTDDAEAFERQPAVGRQLPERLLRG